MQTWWLSRKNAACRVHPFFQEKRNNEAIDIVKNRMGNFTYPSYVKQGYPKKNRSIKVKKQCKNNEDDLAKRKKLATYTTTI